MYLRLYMFMLKKENIAIIYFFILLFIYIVY